MGIKQPPCEQWPVQPGLVVLYVSYNFANGRFGFELLGIPYLVGKISRSNFLFQGPLAKWVRILLPSSMGIISHYRDTHEPIQGSMECHVKVWTLPLLIRVLNQPEFHTHRIHGTGIFTYIYHKNQPNVGKYAIHGSCWEDFHTIHYSFWHYSLFVLVGKHSEYIPSLKLT